MLFRSAAHNSARPSCAGRLHRRCEKLRFDQGLCLGAPDVPVGPSLLDARPKGVASQGKVGESRGAGKPWCPCPFCPRRRAAAIPGRQRRPLYTLTSGELIPSCSPHGAQRAPPGSLRAAPNAAATGSASHSPPQCSSLPPRSLPSRHPIQMVIPAYFFLRFSLFSALLSAPLPYYVPPRPLSSSVSADKIHLQNPEYFAQSTVYKNARIQYNDREHRGSVHGTIWKNPPLRSGP